MRPLVMAITGGSGSMYALRLLDVLIAAGREVHLTISPAATQVLRQETGLVLDLERFDIRQLTVREADDPLAAMFERYWQRPLNEIGHVAASKADPAAQVTCYDYRDFGAGCASGSFLTDGMVICPCSMGTLASLSHGLSSNLIHRAADVHLKERRKLVVVPRETPLSPIALDNMRRLAEAGAIVLPAMPGYYHHPQCLGDLVDFVVGRICDQLRVETSLVRRWGAEGVERR